MFRDICMAYTQLKGKDFYIIKVPGDGNCLFSSLSYFNNGGSIEKGMEVRFKIVNFARENWKQFQIISIDPKGNCYSTVDDYLKDMIKISTYGTYCELIAASQIFPFTFKVWFEGEILDSFGVSSNPTKNLLFSGNLRSVHFDILLERGKSMQDMLPIKKS